MSDARARHRAAARPKPAVPETEREPAVPWTRRAPALSPDPVGWLDPGTCPGRRLRVRARSSAS